MFELMFPAFVASMVLVGMHAYLGIHVIARGVIFVDLALAQVAALGWAAAGLGISERLHSAIGIPEEVAGYAMGIGATLLAAGLLSITRMKHKYVPQEAIIGIIYVVASAGTILLAAQAPRGSEHVEHLLTGSLLWVTWPQIFKTAILYGFIGITHWFLRDRFFTISLHPDEARTHKWSLKWWDFVFYALFGMMVTSSVAIAGVLLVFSFLVIPAVIAFLFTEKRGPLLAIAWSTGGAAAVLGLIVSYQTDLPTGPVVVMAYAFALLAAFAVRAWLKREGKIPESAA
ncbi:MAG: metal ABC transporter permease [Gemmatimonadota bacterium]|nr:metal ABC transporter permease [Gemmatimonadota bacterium]